MATQTDRIETDVVIAAPVERVWELITTPEHVGRWFADAGAQIELRPGGALSLTWREHGTVRGRVEVVEPPHRFVFSWLSRVGVEDEPDAGNSTRAEFTLAPDDEGTRLTVVETGFDALDAPPDQRTAALADHTEGWGKELGELVAYATEAPAAR